MSKDVQRNEAARNLFRQFLRFGAVGVLNTVLFYVLYLLFLTIVRPTTGYYLAYVLSMGFAVLMNLKFTFQERATARKILLLVGVYGLSMYVGGFVLGLLINISISPQIAGLLTIGITLVTNFLGMRAAAKWG
jgi:putative flippase GtrA